MMILEEKLLELDTLCDPLLSFDDYNLEDTLIFDESEKDLLMQTFEQDTHLNFPNSPAENRKKRTLSFLSIDCSPLPVDDVDNKIFPLSKAKDEFVENLIDRVVEPATEPVNKKMKEIAQHKKKQEKKNTRVVYKKRKRNKASHLNIDDDRSDSGSSTSNYDSECSISFQNKIKSEPSISPKSSITIKRDGRGSNSKKVARRWTPQQDQELRVAVEKYNGQNWKAIASMVDGRDHVQCLQRWKKVLQPGLVKGMWSEKEDNLLLQLMSSRHPKNWADIAVQIPGRTAKQCRERWSLNLDPTINRSAWSRAEDKLLLSLHNKLGNRWAEIKRFLVGRTENGVKTRFKSIERAKAKDESVTWTQDLEKQLHQLAVRFECRIDEIAKHLPRVLRGISSDAMRQHCDLLLKHENENEEKNAAAVAAAVESAKLQLQL